MISRLLCDVENRLGTKGADELKVCHCLHCKAVTYYFSDFMCPYVFSLSLLRLIHGLKMLCGTNYMKWRQHLSQMWRVILIRRILWNLTRYPFACHESCKHHPCNSMLLHKILTFDLQYFLGFSLLATYSLLHAAIISFLFSFLLCKFSFEVLATPQHPSHTFK